VTAQVALGLVLVAALRPVPPTLSNLRHTDTGLRTDHLVQFQLDAGCRRLRIARVSKRCFARCSTTCSALPGVSSATLAVAPVLSDALIGFGYRCRGLFTPVAANRPNAVANAVAPGYFGCGRHTLVRGRGLLRVRYRRRRAASRIVSESFVRQYFPHSDPLGPHRWRSIMDGPPRPLP
jgi:putative ABC transport system permease protein